MQFLFVSIIISFMGAECQKCMNTELEIPPSGLHEDSNHPSLQSSKEMDNTKTTTPTIRPTSDQKPQFRPMVQLKKPPLIESEFPTANFNHPKENFPIRQIESDRQEGLEQPNEGSSVLYVLPKEGGLISKILTVPSGKNMTLQKKFSILSKTSNLSQNPERHPNSLHGTYKSIREQQNSQDFQLLDPAVTHNIHGPMGRS